ncbi:MAG TPA: hypothetical protein VK206_01570 [Anaerolineales bacterium]|nr:hypothetical protein [Anaerolineales bacterium]HLO29812.1 hypothetical protein [Anaerolineales bacterium]
MDSEFINSPQTKNTLIATSVSAIICGLMQFEFEWIFWIPGAVFGISFALANFHRKFQIGLYIALSSVIYIGAVQIFFKAPGTDLNHPWAGGFLAGTFGALALAVLTKLVSKTSLVLLDEFRSTLIGGMTGVAFVQLFIFGLGEPFSNDIGKALVLIPVAFAVWQVPVGWLLTTSIQPNSKLSDEFSTKNAPG